MPVKLRQSTAVTLAIGPFVDETDGDTLESGLTISQADVQLSKNGGTFAQKNNATAATYATNGFYFVPLSTTDTNTLGVLTLSIDEVGALPVWREYQVITANAWDSEMAAAVWSVDVTQVNGSASAAAQLGLSAPTIVNGTAQTGTLSTTQMSTNLTEATDDHYNNRVVIWTSGNLLNQARKITDYTGSGGILTFDTATEAPANGDTFIIV